MNILRIFFQHWYGPTNDTLSNASSTDIATFLAIKRVCRESAAMCREAEPRWQFERLDWHMMAYAPNFWQRMRGRFTNMKVLYNDEIPFGDVVIYAGCRAEDLTFVNIIWTSCRDCLPADCRTATIIIHNPGLSKKIIIHKHGAPHATQTSFDSTPKEQPAQHGAPHATQTSFDSTPKEQSTVRYCGPARLLDAVIIAKTEKEYNAALELICAHRNHIAFVWIKDLQHFPVQAPFKVTKSLLEKMRGDQVVNMISLWASLGKPEGL